MCSYYIFDLELLLVNNVLYSGGFRTLKSQRVHYIHIYIYILIFIKKKKKRKAVLCCVNECNKQRLNGVYD